MMMIISQKPIKDSSSVNSISVAVNTESLSQETLNLSEAVLSSPPNLINVNRTNASKVNPFIAVRLREGDYVSKASNQYDNEHKKLNSNSDKNTNKD